MKKILAIAIIMLMTLSVFTACGKKDEAIPQPTEETITEDAGNETVSVTGEYKLTKTISEVGEAEVSEEESETLIFGEDGTLTFNTRDIVGDIENATLDSIQDVTYTGTYTVNGSTVSVTYTSNSGEVSRDYTIEGDTLVFTDETGTSMT